MPTKTVLCIKIAQRNLGASTSPEKIALFPFERIYLCSAETLPALKKTYRYLLYTETTPEIRKALNVLEPTQSPTIGRHRENPETKQTTRPELIEQYPYLCVPTSIRYIRTTTGTPKSGLCYHISKLLRIHHSRKFKGFKLYLKTPGHSGAPVCSWCSRVLDSMDAQCTPGTTSCVSGIITLPLDTNNFSKRTLQKLEKGE
jgi:hypothetical protein